MKVFTPTIFFIFTLIYFLSSESLLNNFEVYNENSIAVDELLSRLNCHTQHSDRATIFESPAFSSQKSKETNNVNLNLDILRSTQILFPKWLSDFTGLSQWPGLDPPYIPLNFIDFEKIPNFSPYSQGSCPVEGRKSCSFDCYKCVEPDDVYSCPKLSQTFDDGPTHATKQLLAKFDITGQKSTFFNLGINVVSHPDIYDQMIKAGHLIGTHTWSHAFLPSLSNEQIIAQIQWSIWAMNATGGHLPKWFRPPYGAIDNRVRAITRQFGLQAVLWNFDTFDWMLLNEPHNQRTEKEILKDVTDWSNNVPKTGLILEHDGTFKTAAIGEKVADIIGPDQLTVNQCVGGIDYIKSFAKSSPSDI
ncbi:hypothetical protein QEN19_003077 [Hanseniaspora menglaensis]